MFAASRSRRRSRFTLAASLAGLALVVAGCSNPGEVNDYNADTRDNFIAACKEGNADTGIDSDRLDEVCGCWYEVVSGDEGLSFDRFEQVEDDIRTALAENRLNSNDDLDSVAGDFYDLIRNSDCLPTGPQG